VGEKMKKVEINKFGLGSVFKVMLYLMMIPMILCFIIGIVMLLAGIATKAYEFVGIGILVAIGYPIFFILVYGLFGTLMALLYNWLAGKFGGLELTIREVDENIIPAVNSDHEQ
jgi:hypothetical protein